MILTGLSGIVLIEIYAAVMQLKFQNSDNKVGKGFAVLGIYLFVITYCKPSRAFRTRTARTRSRTQLTDMGV